MSQERTAEEVNGFLATWRGNFEKRSLMYGGDLSGVETMWYALQTFEAFMAGEDIFGGSTDIDDDLRFRAYAQVASRYKCGNSPLSSKVRNEMGEGREASEELVRRLKEVDVVRAQLRLEKGIGQ